jgi:hypothetical protein
MNILTRAALWEFGARLADMSVTLQVFFLLVLLIQFWEIFK